MNESWGIILAAGESRRMKKAKLSLPFGNSTILECSIDNVLHSDVNHVMIVLGGYIESCKPLISDRPVSICINKDFRNGMLSSVQCGIKCLPGNASVALIYLADQPLIDPEVTNRVLDEWEKNKNGLIVPSCKGKKGHPLLIDMKYRDEIETLDPDIGLRSLLSKHSVDLKIVEVKHSSILYDIDTPKDYCQLKLTQISYGKTYSV